MPFIAWRPGTVPAGKRHDAIAMGIDFLPTFCAMAGAPTPASAVIDGRDISDVILRSAPSPHDALLLFNDEDVVAIRTQRWKYVASSYFHGRLNDIDDDFPQLYDETADITESYSAFERHPDVFKEMERKLANARARFGPMKTSNAQAGSSASSKKD